MKVIETISDLERVEKGSVLTIGNFDGVHLGHRRILREAQHLANSRCRKLVVMTFDPHPLSFLHPEKTPGILTPIALRAKLMSELGVDVRLILKTNEEILGLLPDEFLKRFLVERLCPCTVVEGEDFRFGKDGSGDVGTLQKAGKEFGFDVAVVDTEKTTTEYGETVKVSSTMIRYMLGSSKVADAARLLGRRYRLMGRVIAGRGKGRHIGFPTANLKPEDQVIPAEGVYAGYVVTSDSEDDVCVSDANIAAVFSIGQASTFGDNHPLLVEAHLFADNVDILAGKWMAMDFVEFVRHQHKFRSEIDLSAQIARDCEQAKKILKFNSLATESTEKGLNKRNLRRKQSE
ncbi:MAG: bifunctional riboflavin kinase/FAD synthetase [Phycisphaerae bacterium]|nr:bifunctional riboflavin kinase/FAD synthetase [Phycisphaerae bacterium]